MSMSVRAGRRAFIKMCAGLAALVGTPVHATRRTTAPLSESGLREAAAWARRFRSSDSAGRIGRAYLLRRPAEADLGILYERLSAGLPPGQAAEDPDWGAIVRADFGTGNTVLVEGWLLSRTEARLCALTALV